MFIVDKNTFVTLDALANYFNLPNGYLKELAEKNLIPSLNVNGRLRFSIAGVQQSLDKLTSKGVSDDR